MIINIAWENTKPRIFLILIYLESINFTGENLWEYEIRLNS